MTVSRWTRHGQRLFVYGTLLAPDVMRRVCGQVPPAMPATLPGFVRGGIAGEPYPAIVRSPGACVHGLLYARVTASMLSRLDRYEGGLYRRCVVEVDAGDGLCPAQAYVLDPAYAKRFRRGVGVAPAVFA
jgi:gamma-glutamylcyclotransferase (GGCT)/AIG2-like uncharacterized protein YtfP